MKKYLTFAWNDYEANGGMYDFQGDFDSIEECCDHLDKVLKSLDESIIVNSDDRTIHNYTGSRELLFADPKAKNFTKF